MLHELCSLAFAQQLRASSQLSSPKHGYVPILRSSSCLTSTASLVFWSGWVRFSQAVLTAWRVISEKRARKTWRFGFTVRGEKKNNLSDTNTNGKDKLINSWLKKSMLSTYSMSFHCRSAFLVYQSQIFIKITASGFDLHTARLISE